MFGIGYGGKERPAMRLEEYPSFRPVRSPSHARGTGLLIAGVLLVAALCTGASLTLVGGATAGGFHTGDRSESPARLEAGCDGAWGNEPLDCLLQTA